VFGDGPEAGRFSFDAASRLLDSAKVDPTSLIVLTNSAVDDRLVFAAAVFKLPAGSAAPFE
jgi:uncharacterized membrane protein affecting hemolysin expression